MTLLPLSQMAGAPWNILDATGRRVALCHGNDLRGDSSHDDAQLAALIVQAVNRMATLDPAMIADEDPTLNAPSASTEGAADV